MSSAYKYPFGDVYTVEVSELQTIWYKHDTHILHREDGPAIEKKNGAKYWYLNGELHREDGPAIISDLGAKYWYKHDKRHREDGPAVEYPSGGQEWWVNGVKHRIDGPAIVYVGTDGKFNTYYINGIQYPTKEDFERAAGIKPNPSSCDGKVVEIDGKKYMLTALENIK